MILSVGLECVPMVCTVAKCLKHSTVDQKVPGWNPTCCFTGKVIFLMFLVLMGAEGRIKHHFHSGWHYCLEPLRPLSSAFPSLATNQHACTLCARGKVYCQPCLRSRAVTEIVGVVGWGRGMDGVVSSMLFHLWKSSSCRKLLVHWCPLCHCSGICTVKPLHQRKLASTAVEVTWNMFVWYLMIMWVWSIQNFVVG